MTKIIISEDCGNSPKNIFVQELTIALGSGDVSSVLNRVTDDIRWNIVGERVIQGKDHLAEALEKENKVVELTVHHIATHGRAGAVDGRMKFKSGKTHAFCNIYEFSNAKGIAIKEIISYRIEIK